MVVAREGRQRLSVDVLHHQERPAARLGHLEDGRDVGMGESGRRLRLPLQPGELLAVLELQELEGDPALEAAVPGLPDLARASLSEERDADVAPEALRGVREGFADAARGRLGRMLGRLRVGRHAPRRRELRLARHQESLLDQELAQTGQGGDAGLLKPPLDGAADFDLRGSDEALLDQLAAEGAVLLQHLVAGGGVVQLLEELKALLAVLFRQPRELLRVADQRGVEVQHVDEGRRGGPGQDGGPRLLGRDLAADHRQAHGHDVLLRAHRSLSVPAPLGIFHKKRRRAAISSATSSLVLYSAINRSNSFFSRSLARWMKLVTSVVLRPSFAAISW